MNYQFSIDNHKLDEDELRSYAEMASNIRGNISQRVRAVDEDDKDDASELEIRHMHSEYKTTEEKSSETASNQTLNYNPVHPNRKRRSMRQLSSNERLLLVKLVASKSRTGVEIADLMNVKVQVIYDLMKDLKRKQGYFVKKKTVETKRQLHQTAIVKTVAESLAKKQNI